MMTLYIDISTEVMYLALALETKIIDTEIRIANRDHAAYVVDRIDHLLSRNNVNMNQIKAIVVGQGPGSYTGIRVAVTVAKTLAYAKNIPLFKVSSLIFMTSGYEGLIHAMIDARRGYVFHILYNQEGILEDDAYVKLDDVIGLHQEKSMHVMIDKDSYKIEIKNMQKHMTQVLDIISFEPNYTRITEAESHAR
jgi:tRNA threonylcarbamoyladenosine biosynthesis protein TsaB